MNSSKNSQLQCAPHPCDTVPAGTYRNNKETVNTYAENCNHKIRPARKHNISLVQAHHKVGHRLIPQSGHAYANSRGSLQVQHSQLLLSCCCRLLGSSSLHCLELIFNFIHLSWLHTVRIWDFLFPQQNMLETVKTQSIVHSKANTDMVSPLMCLRTNVLAKMLCLSEVISVSLSASCMSVTCRCKTYASPGYCQKVCSNIAWMHCSFAVSKQTQPWLENFSCGQAKPGTCSCDRAAFAWCQMLP